LTASNVYSHVLTPPDPALSGDMASEKTVFRVNFAALPDSEPERATALEDNGMRAALDPEAQLLTQRQMPYFRRSHAAFQVNTLSCT